ncbi:hypothetical protein Bca4012_006842 [Brassica carinata]
MGVDMDLVDEKSSISACRLNMFHHLLREGSLLMTSGSCLHTFNTDLPDVVSEVRGIKGIFNNETKDHRTHNLHIDRCIHMKYYERNNCLRECFDNLATLLHDKLLAIGLEPKITVATNISLKLIEVIIFLRNNQQF